MIVDTMTRYIAAALALLLAGSLAAHALDMFTMTSAVNECKKLFATKEALEKLITRIEVLEKR